MAARSIQLRWDGRCCRCYLPLRTGATAMFDEGSRRITCLACHTADPGSTARRRGRKERDDVRRLIAEARAALEAAHRRAS